jgi:flavin-binding protein dodecin
MSEIFIQVKEKERCSYRFEVQSIRGHLADGAIEHFQVSMKVGFRLEDS